MALCRVWDRIAEPRSPSPNGILRGARPSMSSEPAASGAVGGRPTSARTVHLLSTAGTARRGRYQPGWRRDTRRNGDLSQPESALGFQDLYEPGATPVR